MRSKDLTFRIAATEALRERSKRLVILVILCPIHGINSVPLLCADHQGNCQRQKQNLMPCLTLFAMLWTIAHLAPLLMEFPRQEYWNGFPFPSPGNLPDPGIKPGSPTLQVDSLPSEPPGKPMLFLHILYFQSGENFSDLLLEKTLMLGRIGGSRRRG